MAAFPSNADGSTPTKLLLIRYALLVGAVSAILFICLLPQPISGTHKMVVVFYGERATADAILNVLLYIPLGIALALLPLRTVAAISVGALLSFMLETTQLFIPGRFSSLTDLVANSLGTGIGVLAIRTSASWIDPPQPLSGLFSSGAAILFASTCLATAYLMQPDLPSGTYVGQWTPDLGQYGEPYLGTVESVEIGPYAVPPTLVEEAEDIRWLLLHGEPLWIIGTAGPPTRSLSPVFRLVRRPLMPLLIIAVEESDLIHQIRRRASRWRLRPPSSVARGIMRQVGEGSDLRIGAWRSETRTCVSVNRRTDCTLRPTVGSGWRLFLPFESHSRILNLMCTFGWLIMLSLPTGFWLRPDSRSIIGLFVMGLAIVLVSFSEALAPTPVIEWTAVAAGLAAGVIMRKLVRSQGGGGRCRSDGVT